MLNDWFTRDYDERLATVQRRIRAGALPVLIRLSDDAILLRKRERRVVRVLSERYHTLKSICHAPLSIYLLLHPRCGRALTAADLEPAGGLLEELQCFAADEPPIRAVRDASIALLAGVCADQHVDEDRLTSYERDTRAEVRACIELAAHDELETLHHHVGAFTATFTKPEWEAFRVVICASHQPRYRQSTKQYFKRLLSEKEGVEGQVLYGENCRTEADALRLLAAHLLDRELAEFFLDSPLDLQQDILGDAAERALTSIFR